MDRSEADRQRALALARALLESLAPCRHGPGFGAVLWYGTYHVFSALQARVVAVLWEAWLNGTPDVRQEHLLSSAGSVAKRLVSVFQGHAAWGTMVVPGVVKGAFRLGGPPPETDMREIGGAADR